MKLWGLIEEKPGTRDDGSPRVGYYRMTDLGRQFVARAVRVPSHVYIYNGELLQRPVEELITIDEALGKDFSYAEIMEAA
jgi:DNA-binding PadR family transcriptional regulator